ncbi:MAG TPA: hypothetical protein VJ768_11455 [Anaerolineales bacterium]|nr:hypothetical protein [Anaerolineales bacterium]
MKRPKSVTLLAVGVLILAGYFFLRAALATNRWELLLEYFPASTMPFYLVLTGVLWGCAFLIVGLALGRGIQWAPRLSRILAVLFAGYWWLDSLFLAVDPAVRGAGFFRLAATILLLAVTFWVLARPAAKKYFGELNG